MSAPPRVLVTGAAGYIGTLVVEAFAARRSELGALVATDVRPPRRIEGVETVVSDICDPSLEQTLRTHQIDAVVHLASVVRPPPDAPPGLAFRVDVEGTRNVLCAAAEAGARQLVVTSSGAAYGYHRENREWLDEGDPLRGHPHFEYSRNKRQVEEILAEWRRTHPELRQLIFRPGTILGERTASPITDLFAKPVLLGVAGARSPFVFVWDADVVACIVRGVFERREGIFNLAGDGAMTTREIARALRKPYLAVPAPVLTGALWALSRLGLTQYGPEQVDFLRYRPVLSNRRLKEEFGYVPQRTSREVFELWASHHAH